MVLIQFFSDLLNNRLDKRRLEQGAAAIFGILLVLALASILSTATMGSRESILFRMAQDFVDRGEISAKRLDFALTGQYISAIPLRAAQSLPLRVQAIILRLWNLVFLFITLWLAYQTAKKVFPRDSFIPLVTLALLAFNNRLFFASVRAGGDIFVFLLFAAFFYVLIEITVRGSLPDILVAAGSLFVFSRLDPQTAQEVLVPLLATAVVGTLLYSYRKELREYLPRPQQQRLAALLAVLVVLTLIPRFFEPAGMFLRTPASWWPMVAGLPNWPVVVGHLVKVFGSSAVLASDFRPIALVLDYIFQLVAWLSVAGLARLAYVVATERVQVVRTAPASSTGDGGGTQIIWVEPDPSVLQDIRLLPVLMTLAVPLTVLAARNGYVLPSAINEGALYLLLVPIAILTAFGLRRIAEVKSLEAVALLSLAILLSFSVAGIIIPTLWT